MCFKVAQTKMQFNLEFSLCMILMMIIIVMLFLSGTFNNFNIPKLYFKVAHSLKCSVSQCNLHGPEFCHATIDQT